MKRPATKRRTLKRRGHWLRIALTLAVIAATMSAATPSSPATAPPAPPISTPATLSTTPRSALAADLRNLRLVNYFPSDAGWQYMWTRWNPGRLDHDFAVIAGLGANAVRITVFPDVMGFPAPSAAMRSRLARILAMAAEHGLSVQLSLFDQFTDFSDIADSLTWARDILQPLAGRPRLAFIDLRNELDAPSTIDDPAVYRWADALLPAVQRDARGVPVTLSVTNPAHLTTLRSALHVQPDFWDLHYYASDGLAYPTMKEAIHSAAPRPVFVGETGFATAADGSPQGLPAGKPSLEAYQAHYYQVVEQAARSLGLSAAAPWSLYDFNQSAIPSRQQPDQYAFGLLRADGTAKPAAAVISRFFHTGSISDDFNNDFSQTVTTPQGDELPALWRRWEPGQAVFALDPAVGHDTAPTATTATTRTTSTTSARISNSAGSNADMPAFYTVPVQQQVAPGRAYRVTAWVRGRAATGTNVVNVSWFDSHGVFISGCDSASLAPGDTDWTELEATGTAPPAAAFAEIWLKSAHNSGTVWFDDVAWTQPTATP